MNPKINAKDMMDARLKSFLQKMHILTFSVLERSSDFSESNKDSKALDLKKSSQILESISIDFEFIESQFQDSSQPFSVHCASCFYAFDKQNLGFIIKSNPESKHILLALNNPIIGVNIATQTKILKRIKGAQIKALFSSASKHQIDLYYHRFPFARLSEGRLYALKILWAKYTDNALFLSEKITYQAPNFKS